MKKIFVISIILTIMSVLVSCDSNNNTNETDIEEVYTELQSSNDKILELENVISKLELELVASEENNINLNSQMIILQNEYNSYKEEKELEKNMSKPYVDYIISRYETDYVEGVQIRELDDNYSLIEFIVNQYDKEVVLYNLSNNEPMTLDVPFWGLKFQSYDNGIIKFYQDGSWPTGGCSFTPNYIYYDIESDEQVYEDILIPIQEHINVGARLKDSQLYNINVIDKAIEFIYEFTDNTIYAGGDDDMNPNLFLGTDTDNRFYIEMVDVLISEEYREELIEELESIDFISNVDIQTKQVSEYSIHNILFFELENIDLYTCEFKYGNSFTITFYQ